MKCPNCRCEVDYRTRICPYCGTQLQSRSGASRREPERHAVSSRSGSMTTTTAYSKPHTGASRSPRHAEGTRRSHHNDRRQNRVYDQIIILLLAALVAINLLELAAILLT